MMRYNDWGPGAGLHEFIGSIILIVVMVDLVLFGVWLWKQINKHN